MKHKIIVAITGASGSIYAKVLLDQLVVLKDQIDAVGIVMSKNAKDVWEFELEMTVIKTILLSITKKMTLWLRLLQDQHNKKS